jgi:hypothetical protein
MFTEKLKNRVQVFGINTAPDRNALDADPHRSPEKNDADPTPSGSTTLGSTVTYKLEESCAKTCCPDVPVKAGDPDPIANKKFRCTNIGRILCQTPYC